MKFILGTCFLLSQVVCAHALIINEVLSNPIGDDGGREWIEVYNNSDTDVDLTSLTISIKGGSFIPVTPVSGGTTLVPHGYAIIGSTVSGATKFMLDYPSFSKPLFKSGISLVNTGVTSIELKIGGVVVDTLASYTAAKEGNTYSYLSGSFVSGVPTPGEENQAAPDKQEDATTTPTSSQVGIAKMSSPSADIVLYLPLEKTVVAGAPSLFSVSSLTHAGKVIDGMSYVWSFGDGGERTGSSTLYRYFYPGRYVAQVEGTNGFIAGTGRMMVRVVTPDLRMSSINDGKYGKYIDITNPNPYDLDISGWKLVIDSVPYSFPKNTILLGSGDTHVSGAAMGFASTTVSSSTLIKLLFPSMDEVLRVYQGESKNEGSFITSALKIVSSKSENKVVGAKPIVSKMLIQKNNSPQVSILKATSTKPLETKSKKDTRLASYFRSLFK